MDAPFATWESPTGLAADSARPKIQRAVDYVKRQNTRLLGKRIIPNAGTVYMILQAHDAFGTPLTVDKGSYSFEGEYNND